MIIIFGERPSSPRNTKRETRDNDRLSLPAFANSSAVETSIVFVNFIKRGRSTCVHHGRENFENEKNPITISCYLYSQKQECSNSNLELETAQLNHAQYYTGADPFLQFEHRQQVRGINPPRGKGMSHNHRDEYETLSILQREACRK